MKLAALAMISAVVISGMLYALIQTLRPLYSTAHFLVAVCIKLLSAQGGYRDKTLNGR
jgi:hypothetical protein